MCNIFSHFDLFDSGRSSIRVQIAPASIAFKRVFLDEVNISMSTFNAHELALVQISSETRSNNDLNKSIPCSCATKLQSNLLFAIFSNIEIA
ncbi:hypothetical protein LguiB_012639 [Lonicera macranthoides]